MISHGQHHIPEREPFFSDNMILSKLMPAEHSAEQRPDGIRQQQTKRLPVPMYKESFMRNNRIILP